MNLVLLLLDFREDIFAEYVNELLAFGIIYGHGLTQLHHGTLDV